MLEVVTNRLPDNLSEVVESEASLQAGFIAGKFLNLKLELAAISC